MSSKLKLIIIIGVALFLLLGVTGIFAFIVLPGMQGDAENQEQTETSEEKGDDHSEETLFQSPVFHELPTMIVNLSQDAEVEVQEQRYLKTSISFEMEKPDANDEFNKSLPKIQHTVIMTLSSKKYEELLAPTGKVQLSGEIKSRVNSILTTVKIKKVYLTEFVMQ